MLKLLKILFILFLPLTLFGQVSTMTDTFYVTDDSYVRGGTYSSNNYGTSTEVFTKNHSLADYDRLGLLQFNVGSAFAGATMATLYVYAITYTNVNCSIYRSDGTSWDESTVTWSSKPATGTKIVDLSISTISTWYNLTTTDYVDSLIANGDSIITFIMWDELSPTDESISIDSKEASSGTYKAYLVVQYEDWGPDRNDIILCVEERDYQNQGCSDQYPGYTGRTHYLKYPSLEYQDFADSIFCHYNNSGYNDSGQSYVIGNTQYQANCACKPNPGPYLNMYIRKFSNKEMIDSLTILDDGESLRLTLQGVNRYPGTDSLLISGYLRVGHPSTITGSDRGFGIYTWKYPSETTAYLRFAVPMRPTGIAIDDDSLCYLTSEDTDTMYVINWQTWTLDQKVKLASTGTDNRGCTLVEGDTLIAIMDKNNDTMRFYHKETFSLIRSVNFADRMYIPNNLLYGSWFEKVEPKTPIVIRH